MTGSLRSKGWWDGAIGGVLSTVIGIALTFGVSAWISRREDKQQAREMMFNIVRMEKANGDVVAQYDTLFTSHLEAADQLIEIYRRTVYQEEVDELTADTVTRCIAALFTYKTILIPYVGTEKYFYDAEIMHRFGNSVAYSYFCRAVEFDQETCDDIRSLTEMWYAFSGKMDYRIHVSTKDYTMKEFIAEMIEDHSLTDYADRIREVNLPWRVSFYKGYYEGLLVTMDATEEDYQDYLKSVKATDEKHKVKYTKQDY